MYMEGCGLGFRSLHTAVEPLANGTSNPAAETTLRNLEASGLAHALDLDALAAVSAHFRGSAREAAAARTAAAEFDAAYYHHQLPGGMVTTMRRMLEEMRRPELFDAVLEEVGRVRAEIGYPIIVTPVSQLVGTQAVMNVIDDERCVEHLRRRRALLPRALRRAGRAARLRTSPTACCRDLGWRSCAASEPLQPRRRSRALRTRDLRRGAAASADHARGAGGRDAARRRQAPIAGGLPRPGRHPFVRCSTRCRATLDHATCGVQSDDDAGAVASCGLTTSAASCFDVDGTLVHRGAGRDPVQPGASEVLDRIRASGRRFALFTNGSHCRPRRSRSELRAVGLPVGDDEMLSPLCSALVLPSTAHRRDGAVLLFGTEDRRAYLDGRMGVRIVEGDDAAPADAVFVAAP